MSATEHKAALAEYEYHVDRYCQRRDVSDEQRISVRNHLKNSEKRQGDQKGDFQALDAILGFKSYTHLSFPISANSEDLVKSLFNGREYPSVTLLYFTYKLYEKSASYRATLFQSILKYCPNVSAVKHFGIWCLEDFRAFLLQLSPSKFQLLIIGSDDGNICNCIIALTLKRFRNQLFQSGPF
jgi:hypothetical protein